jgi:hypothetical protein
MGHPDEFPRSCPPEEAVEIVEKTRAPATIPLASRPIDTSGIRHVEADVTRAFETETQHAAIAAAS